MEYWRGIMDWEVIIGWVCETCGHDAGLEWGMVHAQCRCNECHTQYTMRADDEGRTILATPKCTLKDEYKEPLKNAYAKYQVPLSEMTDEMIDEFMPIMNESNTE